MDEFASTRERSPRQPGAAVRFDRADVDRARILAESVARDAVTLQSTLALADEALRQGLASAGRGDYPNGCRALSRALIASALAAWQMRQLAVDAAARGDAPAAQQFRAAAATQFGELPGRARIAANAFLDTPAAAACLAELRGAVLAFVFGGIARERLADGTRPAWLWSLRAAFEPVPDGVRASAVAGCGLPVLVHEAEPGLGPRTRPRGKPLLSNREREVLELIVAGLNTHEIAYRLGVKATTVSTLVGRIFNKLGVNNRPAAVAIALRQGLCGDSGDLAA